MFVQVPFDLWVTYVLDNVWDVHACVVYLGPIKALSFRCHLRDSRR